MISKAMAQNWSAATGNAKAMRVKGKDGSAEQRHGCEQN